MKYDENKYNEVSDIIEERRDHELEGDLYLLVEWLNEILENNKKKYHRIRVISYDGTFTICGDRLERRIFLNIKNDRKEKGN